MDISFYISTPISARKNKYFKYLPYIDIMRTIRAPTLSVSETMRSSSFDTVSLSDIKPPGWAKHPTSESFARLSESTAINDVHNEKICKCVIL